MHERYILMPCRCQIYKEQNLALKSVSIVDKSDEIVVLKVECLYCHKIRRIKLGIAHYYELFWVHERSG